MLFTVIPLSEDKNTSENGISGEDKAHIEQQLQLAKSHSAQNEEKQAQEILLEVLKKEPHCSPALFMLGGSYFVTRSFTEAAVIFEQLVLMFPGDGKASTGLYNARWQAGQATEAIEEIKRFIQNADRVAERETIDAYLRIVETLSADEGQAPN